MQTIAYNSDVILYAGLKYDIPHEEAYKMFIGLVLSENDMINLTLEELALKEELPFKILESFIKESDTNNITFISNKYGG